MTLEQEPERGAVAGLRRANQLTVRNRGMRVSGTLLHNTRMLQRTKKFDRECELFGIWRRELRQST